MLLSEISGSPESAPKGYDSLYKMKIQWMDFCRLNYAGSRAEWSQEFGGREEAGEKDMDVMEGDGGDCKETFCPVIWTQVLLEPFQGAFQ